MHVHVHVHERWRGHVSESEQGLEPLDQVWILGGKPAHHS